MIKCHHIIPTFSAPWSRVWIPRCCWRGGSECCPWWWSGSCPWASPGTSPSGWCSRTSSASPPWWSPRPRRSSCPGSRSSSCPAFSSAWCGRDRWLPGDWAPAGRRVCYSGASVLVWHLGVTSSRCYSYQDTGYCRVRVIALHELSEVSNCLPYGLTLCQLCRVFLSCVDISLVMEYFYYNVQAYKIKADCVTFHVGSTKNKWILMTFDANSYS